MEFSASRLRLGLRCDHRLLAHVEHHGDAAVELHDFARIGDLQPVALQRAVLSSFTDTGFSDTILPLRISTEASLR